METVAQLINALGGDTVVAQLTGVRNSAVRNWRMYGAFPPRLAIRLKRAAEARGLEAPDELFREGSKRAA